MSKVAVVVCPETSVKLPSEPTRQNPEQSEPGRVVIEGESGCRCNSAAQAGAVNLPGGATTEPTLLEKHRRQRNGRDRRADPTA